MYKYSQESSRCIRGDNCIVDLTISMMTRSLFTLLFSAGTAKLVKLSICSCSVHSDIFYYELVKKSDLVGRTSKCMIIKNYEFHFIGQITTSHRINTAS